MIYVPSLLPRQSCLTVVSCSLLLACGWEKQKVSVDVIEKEICALDLVELAQETLADVASSRLSHGGFDFFLNV